MPYLRKDRNGGETRGGHYLVGLRGGTTKRRKCLQASSATSEADGEFITRMHDIGSSCLP